MRPREAGDHWLSGTKGTSGGRGAGPALFCGSRLCLISRGGVSARRDFRFKSCRSILEKVPLKSGANQVDLAKAADVAVDLLEHCTLVLKYRAT